MTASLLQSGDCLFYRQKPMQLLFRQRKNVWRVQPIFLEGPAYDQKINPSDTVQLLHSSLSQRR
jgi:hypothetical protein